MMSCVCRVRCRSSVCVDGFTNAGLYQHTCTHTHAHIHPPTHTHTHMYTFTHATCINHHRTCTARAQVAGHWYPRVRALRLEPAGHGGGGAVHHERGAGEHAGGGGRIATLCAGACARVCAKQARAPTGVRTPVCAPSRHAHPQVCARPCVRLWLRGRAQASLYLEAHFTNRKRGVKERVGGAALLCAQF